MRSQHCSGKLRKLRCNKSLYVVENVEKGNPFAQEYQLIASRERSLIQFSHRHLQQSEQHIIRLFGCVHIAAKFL